MHGALVKARYDPTHVHNECYDMFECCICQKLPVALAICLFLQAPFLGLSCRSLMGREVF